MDLYRSGKYADAVRHFERARQSFERSGDRDAVKHASIYNAKGAALDSLGKNPDSALSKRKYEEAKKCYTDAIFILEEALFKDLSNTNSGSYDKEDIHHLLALGYHNKGYVLGNLSKYDDAIENFQVAASYLEQIEEENQSCYKTLHADIYRNKGFAEAMKGYNLESLDDEGHYRDAIDCLEKAISLDPDFALAHNTCGYVYEIFENHKRAIECYQKATEINPNLVLSWYNRGYAIYHLGKNDKEGSKEARSKFLEALDCFDKAIKIDPGVPWPWYYKGYVLYDAFRDYDQALLNLNKVLEIDPTFAAAWYSKGSVLKEMANFQESLECFETAKRYLEKEKDQNSKNVDYRKFACIWYSEGDTYDAWADAIKSIDNNLSKNKYMAARECFNQVESILNKRLGRDDIQKEQLYQWLALVYRRKGYTVGNIGNLSSNHDAIKCFELALDYTKKSKSLIETEFGHNFNYETELADIYRNKGFVHAKLRDYTKAEKCFKEAIDLSESFPYAWNSKGYHILKMYEEQHHGEVNNELLEAIEHFEKAITYFKEGKNEEDCLDSGIIYPYYNKGYALYLKGDYEAAIDCFDKIIKIMPKFVDAWYTKGMSIYSIESNNEKRDLGCDLRMHEAAIICFEQTIEAINSNNNSYSFRDAHNAWYNKGVVLHSIKRYEEAIKCFDEATKLNSDHFESWYNKGVVLHSIKRYEEAIKCFDEALKIIKRKENLDNEMITASLYYKGYAHYQIGKNTVSSSEHKENRRRYEEAIKCFDEAIHYFKPTPDETPSKYGVDKFSIYFMRGSCSYHINDFGQSRRDFEEIQTEKMNNHKKNHVYNNIGICYYQQGGNDEKAIDYFEKAINIDEDQPNAYYNLAILYNRQKKQDKVKDIIDRCPNDFSTIKEIKMNMDHHQSSDWYSWWFSHGNAKKLVGIALIASILAPLIGIAIVLDDVYLVSQDNPLRTGVSKFIGTNAAVIVAAFIVVIGIVVGILLLPSLHTFKVGTIELETARPLTDIGPVSLSFTPLISNTIRGPNEFDMALQYEHQIFPMPLKYQRQRFVMPIDYVKMPMKFL